VVARLDNQAAGPVPGTLVETIMATNVFGKACVVGLVLAAMGVGAAQAGNNDAAAKGVSLMATAANEFAWSYTKRLAGAQEGNLFVSPLSVHTALSMTWLGAEGATQQQMTNALGFSSLGSGVPEAAYPDLLALLGGDDDAPYELRMANALWGQQGFGWKPSFLSESSEVFGAALRDVDFAGATEQARQAINTWVEDQTNDRIRELFPPGILDQSTRMVLTNAVYFKGDWKHPFPEAGTREQTFHLSETESVETPMMGQTEEFDYFENETVQAVRLPYEGGDLSMLIVLPREADGLAEVAGSMGGAYDACVKGLARREVSVTLPKFKLTWEGELKESLQAMRITDAFDPAKADFSGMLAEASAERLFISSVRHKAFVDVNEEGTEAAAATGVAIKLTAMPAPPVEFRADRPFLFVIQRDMPGQRGGVVLFVGRVMDPTGYRIGKVTIEPETETPPE